ncbi:HAD family hydrolase [Cryptosporangium arvum]|jgi:beta-phosphoglucomutase family hydrolase|uniref:Beta-phosphoglucomutase n=1 Tax=Cryptosporangium arvum DSM 44712 TaxID=927661 RepID=A0A010ZWC4_9ACTN|nr:beta-phosphoglucomutase family hydrolase [Cryptosporangium arvum]EXG81517.1 haloacid dehalogenase superfamily protein, subfamily IA, variant 3 with third motif having DD or ED/beta-phosphoglucomutase family hydrolase [Cryptosporangium arvum DSM 44712]
MTLGLPPTIRACLFDLDGVVTRTAAQHATAWKTMFDRFLADYAPDQRPFGIEDDYVRYVDGRKRLDGTRAFLVSRGIDLPEGTPDDTLADHTVLGLSNAKNTLVLRLIEDEGVEVFDDAVAYVTALRAAGLPRAVVTSSANAQQVLEVTGLAPLFDTRVDAVVAAERGLAGKPSPDTFLAGADLLGVAPGEAAVFEDALSGVEAGRAGGFGFVVGVDRVGQAAALTEHGADVVVTALTDLQDLS